MNQNKHPRKKPLANAVAGAMDFKGLGDWFEVFKGGEQTDSKGRTREFTEADLDSIIANHKPAPLVVGHPKDSDPAYGWSRELKRDGLTLFARADRYPAEFEAAVKNHHFPERSVSLESDGNGGLRLRHIGFLGAVAPAVEGLAGIDFSAASDASAEIYEFSIESETSSALTSLKRMLGRVREFFIQEKGIEEADRLLPSWELDGLDFHVNQIKEGQDDSRFSQTPQEDSEMSLTQKDVDNAKAAEAARADAAEARLAKMEYQARVNESQVLIDGLVKDGKLLPAQATGLAEFMANLASGDDQVFEFSAGDNKTQKQTPFDFAKSFLGGLGKQVKLGRDDQSEPERTSHEFSAPSGYSVSEDRAALHNKAMDYSRKHSCSYEQAIQIVSEV